jgi:hypothetical protein
LKLLKRTITQSCRSGLWQKSNPREASFVNIFDTVSNSLFRQPDLRFCFCYSQYWVFTFYRPLV